METIKPWIIKRITELLGYEDEIVCEYVLNMLSEQVTVNSNFGSFTRFHFSSLYCYYVSFIK